MKTTPIIFSGESVRAILEGRKWQTRRLVKPQPTLEHGVWRWKPKGRDVNVEHMNGAMCPKGGVGDRLWVKETFSVLAGGQLILRADRNDWNDEEIGWRSSMFMPRWASRITLEIADLRVQPVQDISEADAVAEGVKGREEYARLWDSLNAKRGYPWASNPMVWAISFKRIQPEGMVRP